MDSQLAQHSSTFEKNSCLVCLVPVTSKNSELNHGSLISDQLIVLPRLLLKGCQLTSKTEIQDDWKLHACYANLCPTCAKSVAEGNQFLKELESLENKINGLSDVLKQKIIQSEFYLSNSESSTNPLRNRIVNYLKCTGNTNEQFYAIGEITEAESSTPPEERFENLDADVPHVESEVELMHETQNSKRKCSTRKFTETEVGIIIEEVSKISGFESVKTELSIWENIARVVSTTSDFKYYRSAKQCQKKFEMLFYDCRSRRISPSPNMLASKFNEGPNHIPTDGNFLNNSPHISETGSSFFQDLKSLKTPLEKLSSEPMKTQTSTARRNMPTFTNSEVSILMEEVSKATKNGSSLFQKENADIWEKIAETVSTTSDLKFPRSAKQCMKKYSNLKYGKRNIKGKYFRNNFDTKEDNFDVGDTQNSVIAPNLLAMLKPFKLELTPIDPGTKMLKTSQEDSLPKLVRPKPFKLGQKLKKQGCFIQKSKSLVSKAKLKLQVKSQKNQGISLLKLAANGQPKFVKYPCTYPNCEAKYAKLAGVIRHCQKAHPGWCQRFKCTSCPASYSTQVKLAKHLKTHECRSRKECPHCSIMFANSESLKNHVGAIHEKKEAFKCETCKKGFPIKKYYTKHISRCSMKSVENIIAKDDIISTF